MPAFHAGRHELGQNFLSDRRVIRKIVDLVERTDGPIFEIGCGSGALTLPLEKLGRPLTAIDIDTRRVQRLRQRVSESTRLVSGDFLRHPLPGTPHVLVGNLPFHHTTAMLRRILHARHWTSAVLLVQWEVARRRAGVGGATMMTAQWWPWYEFTLVQRVPAAAFAPRPSVDGGLMTVERRQKPLIEPSHRRPYAGFVHAVFTGKGRGLQQILRHAAPNRRTELKNWLAARRLHPQSLPRDLSAAQWAELYILAVQGITPGENAPGARVSEGGSTPSTPRSHAGRQGSTS